MSYSFYAYISRMKNIGRWALMKNSFPENVQEHSHMVAVIAHALSVIRRDIYKKEADPNAAAAAALFHDASEILTGDMPTPVKYHNPGIMEAYKQIEKLAENKLLEMLPKELRPEYERLIKSDNDELHAIVKAADKLAAYIKCLEEYKTGNNEFVLAQKQIKEKLEAMNMPEVDYFMEKFIPAFDLTLDELNLDEND